MKNIKKILALTTLSFPEIAFATEYIVCGENDTFPLIAAQIVSTLIIIIKIAVPILLVISGMIAFFKVTFAGKVEEELKKAKSKLITNIIAAVIIFFTISIVNFAVSLVAGKNNKVMQCVDCFINPDKCPTTDSKNNMCFGFTNGEYDENCNLIKKEEQKTTNTPNRHPEKKKNKSSNKSTTSSDSKVKTLDDATYIDGVLIVNKTYSIPENYGPTQSYGECTSQNCFSSQTWNAYNSMINDAMYSNIYLKIGSGTRTYQYQKDIYNNYVQRDGQQAADTYSARPGHSEHQTGLAMDLCSTNGNVPCINSGFDNTQEAKWLNDNCYKYGFIIRYPQGKTDKTGYKYESWHVRYVGKELAQKLYNNGDWITLEEYFGITSQYE